MQSSLLLLGTNEGGVEVLSLVGAEMAAESDIRMEGFAAVGTGDVSGCLEIQSSIFLSARRFSAAAVFF